ncbi:MULTISPECIES: hypothetical protein [Paraburkholderia]|nr:MULTISPECIES: hypothetical protein [Paraburkholderia]MCX4160147.1 hypothetical protein [Paraburkholderia megapolitana]MDN7155646.1 hypothetical protein [Paraburkholderia sp. CHISQ3]MDQ6492690.1 hypothetical protein [Paraburkholderia megapolitana]
MSDVLCFTAQRADPFAYEQATRRDPSITGYAPAPGYPAADAPLPAQAA